MQWRGLSWKKKLPSTHERRNRAGQAAGLLPHRVMAHVVVKIGKNTIDSVITRKSAEEMRLKKGDIVTVVIKSSEVMLQKG